MATHKYINLAKSNKFRKTRSKKVGGITTRSGKDTSKVNKTNTRVIKKTKPVKEKEVCPICIEEFKKTDNIPKLPCKHKFHKECLVPVCNGKNNINVPCPICRGDITDDCKSNINPLPPTTHQLSYRSFNNEGLYNRNMEPYVVPRATLRQLMNMTMEERNAYQTELRRHRNNYLARRRRAIARETPQQTAQREEREQEFRTRLRENRDRYFNGRNNNHILTRGLPLPESPPRSPEGPPPGWIPRSPEGPPPLTMEDLRTSSSPASPNYNPNSPVYAPGSPDYSPGSPTSLPPRWIPDSPEGPPPLTMEDLITPPPPPLTMEDLATDDSNDNMRGGKKRKNRKTRKSKKTKRKTRKSN